MGVAKIFLLSLESYREVMLSFHLPLVIMWLPLESGGIFRVCTTTSSSRSGALLHQMSFYRYMSFPLAMTYLMSSLAILWCLNSPLKLHEQSEIASIVRNAYASICFLWSIRPIGSLQKSVLQKCGHSRPLHSIFPHQLFPSHYILFLLTLSTLAMCSFLSIAAPSHKNLLFRELIFWRMDLGKNYVLNQ